MHSVFCPGPKAVVLAIAISACLPSAAFAQLGSISGTVSSGGSPVAGLVVQIFNSVESSTGSAVTNAAGAFTVSNLPPGIYYAYANAANTPGGFVDVLYPNQQCAGLTIGGSNAYCRVNTGDSITVTAGNTTSGINFSLVAGGSISGVVAGAGVALNASVELHLVNGSNASTIVPRQVATSASGAYSLGRLPAGTYYVWAGNVTGGALSSTGFVPEMYDNVSCPKVGGPGIPTSGSGCTVANLSPVSVSLGVETAASFDLAEGGAIGGTVTLDGTRAFAAVVAYTLGGTPIWSAGTSIATSGYLLRGLPPGQYHLVAQRAGYVSEVYDNVSCPTPDCQTVLNAGVPVTVTSGAVNGGRNFDLVASSPAIESPPAAQLVMSGQTATLSVVATGASPLSYQWYLGDSGDTSAPVPGANAAIFTTRAITSPARYWVRVSNSAGVSNSQPAQLTPANPGTGSIAGTVTSGAVPLASIQITVYSANEGNVASLPTSVDGAFSIANLAPGNYYVFASGGNVTGGFVNTLYPDTECAGPALGVGTYCRINTGTAIAVAANIVTAGIDFDLPVGGAISGAITTQGFLPLSAAAGLWVDTISGAMSIPSVGADAFGHYVIRGLPAGSYRVSALSGSFTPEVWDDVPCGAGGCGLAGGTPVPVVLGVTSTGKDFDLALRAPSITTQPQSQSIATGLPATLSVVASGDPTLAYQWYRGPSGTTTDPVAGAMSSSYTTPALNANATYWVRVTNDFGTANSTTATVTVGTPPSIGTQPMGLIIASGGSATLNVIANGTVPLNYQWYVGATGTTTTPIGGATSSTYVTPALTLMVDYWVRVSSPFGSVDSVTATVAIGTPPTITAHPQSITINEGQSTTLTVSATGTPTLTYQWYQGGSGVTTLPVGTGTSYGTPALSAVTSYWVRVSSPYGVAMSNAAVVTPAPNVGVPTNVHARTIVGNMVTLAWRQSPGQLPVTGYVLDGGLPGQTAPLVSLPTGNTLTTMTIGVPNGSFWIRMRALSGATSSLASAQMPLCLNASCPPIAPTNVLGLANGAALSLTWRSPLESGVPTSLLLQVSGSLSGSLGLPGTAETFAFPTMPSGVYNFALVACTPGGCSAPSAPVTLSFPGACSPPAVPANFAVTRSGSVLAIDWGLPASGAAPNGYLLNVTSPVFTGSVPLPVSGFTGAVPPGTYTLSVAAANVCGVGPATTSVTVAIP